MWMSSLGVLRLPLQIKCSPTQPPHDGQAEGGRAFCAGGDIKQILQGRLTAGSPKPEGCGPVDYITVEYRLDAMIHHLAAVKPVVAVADGIVMGGGAGLFEGAGLRVATAGSTFAMPECRIAILPDAGAMFFLTRVRTDGRGVCMSVLSCVTTAKPSSCCLVHPAQPFLTRHPQAPGQVPMYVALTGARLSGRCMRATGLATHLVESVDVPGLLQRLRGLEDVSRATVEAAVAAHAVRGEDEEKAPVRVVWVGSLVCGFVGLGLVRNKTVCCAFFLV